MVILNSVFNILTAVIFSSTLIHNAVAIVTPSTSGYTLPPFIPSRLVVRNQTQVDNNVTSIPTATELANLKKYAEIAATAYCRTVVPLNSWNCAHCKTSVPDGVLITTFTSLIDDTNGFVLRSDKDKTIYLVLRGTNSFRSGVVDAQFILTSYPGVNSALIHLGFLTSYDSIVKSYFPVIQNQLTLYPSYKVLVTGHSLGGAQAQIAALDLYKRDSRLNGTNLKIVTYGSPRVGNPVFANYAAGTGIPHSRVVHKADIVPQVPPVFSGYLHYGVENWIYADPDSVRVCDSILETPYCSNTIFVPTITDHLAYFDINEGLCL